LASLLGCCPALRQGLLMWIHHGPRQLQCKFVGCHKFLGRQPAAPEPDSQRGPPTNPSTTVVIGAAPDDDPGLSASPILPDFMADVTTTRSKSTLNTTRSNNSIFQLNYEVLQLNYEVHQLNYEVHFPNPFAVSASPAPEKVPLRGHGGLVSDSGLAL
jgi:hypothetical protein